jgi:hypothetical protein
LALLSLAVWLALELLALELLALELLAPELALVLELALARRSCRII